VVSSKSSFDSIRELINGPDFSVQVRAAQEMIRRAKTDSRQVKQYLLLDAGPDGEHVVAARRLYMGALQSVWDDDVRKFFYARLTDGDADVRRLAADGLALTCTHGDIETHNELTKTLYESDPAVRRALVLAIGRIGAPGAEDVLVNVFRADHGKDIYLTDGIIRAIERLGDRGVRRLVDLADSGVSKDLDRVVDAFLTLRTPAGAKALPDLLK